ncbi:hypothetical protein SAMN06265222_12410 [Neorhodopirellula lusitana]|uniref:Helix-turn-helix domain-containing protein n=1 Tax=Neorhodopirellula lusitana TaxID=445327 RepID=A0ABY1QQ40_9BACT|nr:helix-turn-helix domain-containing protein [Neorhodopirellula lusitana]SMP77888.1 hypothetical protein SAMN06265222_12410 [Neorhodopirellula lusitana]
MAELTMSAADLDRLAEPIAERVWELLADRVGKPAAAAGPVVVDREALAGMLGVSTATIDRRTRAGLIPSIGDGNTRRFIVTDVLDAMKRQALREVATVKPPRVADATSTQPNNEAAGAASCRT